MMSETQDLFDKQYKKRSPLFGTLPTNVVTELCKLLPDKSTIVDLGAGDGRDTLFLLKSGFKVLSVDFSIVGLNKLSEKAKQLGVDDRLSIKAIDVMKWRPSPDSFNAILGVTILDHLNIADARRLVDRIKEVTCVRGYICLEMYSDRDPAFTSESDKVSEFADVIKFFSPTNWLIEQFAESWRVIFYSDRLEQDLDHGEPHYHGFSTIIVQRVT